MICLLIVIQDFGTAALIAICALTMLLAGGSMVAPRHHDPAGAARGRVVHHAQGIPLAADDRVHRPVGNPQREGYHMIQSLLSFSTGGVTGRGLGNGIQKLGYLPRTRPISSSPSSARSSACSARF
jgi:cell division protein FtsW